MIFSQRALQRRLEELRRVLPAEAIDQFVARLNRRNRDRMAAMWEVVIIHALSQQGRLTLEQPLETGRRPDIVFDGSIAFTTDVTSISDEGLDEANPVHELMDKIEKAKSRLGLPIGGMDLQVGSREIVTRRGAKRSLRLPSRGRLDDLIQISVVPALRAQMAAGATVLRLEVDEDDIAFNLTIDPSRTPYSSGGYAAYAAPTIKDDNPLYRALKAKAQQLRGVEGLKGIIVGDASASALRPTHGQGTHSIDAIVQEFLRQHQSVDFVVTVTVREHPSPVLSNEPSKRTIEVRLGMRPDGPNRAAFAAVFETMSSALPAPAMMPVNGAMRAREDGYDLGHHGGYTMNSKTMKVGARELVEVLAGLRTFADDGAKNVEARRARPSAGPNRIEGWFLRQLMEGRLPSEIRVIKGAEDEGDDWIEFEFGPVDPAISPFR